MTALRPGNDAEMAELLRSRPGRLRLWGSGSRQDRTPDAGAALRLDLGAFAAIERLDAPDQTCTVGAAVRRAVLDDALRPHRLELPCLGDGTLGGLFAADPIGAATVGGHSPRTLLLGCDAMLADGTAFKSGARVVKSVAGFDVHKLLVGSQGRLFAALRLHLRLKPAPRSSCWFAVAGLAPAEAIARFVALRSLAMPPAQLHLQRTPAGWTLRGRIAGRGSFVGATMRAHQLDEAGPVTELHLDAPAGGEVLAGAVLPSCLPALLAAAPPDTPFLLHGGCRFELALPSPAAADALLLQLPPLDVPACIVAGAPARRGRGTALDPGHQRLAAGIQQALDPHGTFV